MMVEVCGDSMAPKTPAVPRSEADMTRDDLAALVLTELSRREAEIAKRKPPPAWKKWEVGAFELDRDFGPKYSPTWFGDAAETEAGRQRFLRTVYQLERAGLVVLWRSEAGRLERVQLTAEGRAAVAELAATPAAAEG
jgi:hypothetical protein